jgi:hypothetical protein
MDREIDSNQKVIVMLIVIAFCGLGIVLLNSFSFAEGKAAQMKFLNAVVKGSIYGDGEHMSVFGTCVDANDIPVFNSTGILSAWYPNGTQFIFSDVMSKMAEGYFLWEGNMSLVGGTYLTEFECDVIIDGIPYFAKAQGEWQNPYWVRNIAWLLELQNLSYLLLKDMNGTLIGINMSLGDIELLLETLNLSMNWSNVEILQAIRDAQANITANISESITTIVNQLLNSTSSITNNITFLTQNMTTNFNYTNSLILQTQVIANASVDRNNSYLAYLMLMMINGSGIPVTHNLTWTEQYENPWINRWWKDQVWVYDEYGHSISSPTVACIITTNQHGTNYMETEGNHFSIQVFVYDWTFIWNVSCYYT